MRFVLEVLPCGMLGFWEIVKSTDGQVQADIVAERLLKPESAKVLFKV